MSNPKKHHYLPQFYLRNFQYDSKAKSEQIIVWNKDAEASSFIAAIDSTGCERDFHTIDHDDSEQDRTSIEAIMSKVESIHSVLVQDILRDRLITNANQKEIPFFLSLMRNRNPSIKEFIRESQATILTSTANMMQENGQFPEPPKQIKEVIDQGLPWFGIKISNWYLLQWMFYLANEPQILSLLAQMNISLLEAPKDDYFISSDSPVAFYVPNYDKTTRPYGVGLVHKAVELTLPISQKYALLCSWNKNQLNGLITQSDVKEINRRTIVMAQNYIYSHRQCEDISDAIKQHHHKRAGHNISNLEHEAGSMMISRFIPVSD